MKFLFIFFLIKSEIQRNHRKKENIEMARSREKNECPICIKSRGVGDWEEQGTRKVDPVHVRYR